MTRVFSKSVILSVAFLAAAKVTTPAFAMMVDVKVPLAKTIVPTDVGDGSPVELNTSAHPVVDPEVAAAEAEAMDLAATREPPKVYANVPKPPVRPEQAMLDAAGERYLAWKERQAAKFAESKGDPATSGENANGRGCGNNVSETFWNTALGVGMICGGELLVNVLGFPTGGKFCFGSAGAAIASAPLTLSTACAQGLRESGAKAPHTIRARPKTVPRGLRTSASPL